MLKMQRGFTLVEILITLLVVSLGLMGFAALLTRSVVMNRDAYQRTQATVLTHDLVERMRANRAGAMAGAYNMTDKSKASADDLVDWTRLLTDSLPGGDATVTASLDGDNLAVQVIVRWLDGQTTSGLTTQTKL
jgi:type IV pilus assembly protein PilV